MCRYERSTGRVSPRFPVYLAGFKLKLCDELWVREKSLMITMNWRDPIIRIASDSTKIEGNYFDRSRLISACTEVNKPTPQLYWPTTSILLSFGTENKLFPSSCRMNASCILSVALEFRQSWRISLPLEGAGEPARRSHAFVRLSSLALPKLAKPALAGQICLGQFSAEKTELQ